MRHSERTPGRGLAPTAAADWRAADLPAALQGGARQAIFRGLYKGAEAAAGRSGSWSTGEGRCDTRTGSRDAEAGRARAARWPPTLAAGFFRGAGALSPCGSEGTGRPGGRSGGALPGAGFGGRLLREQPVERRCSRRGREALCNRPSCHAWGRRAARERSGSGRPHVPQTKAPKSPFRTPHGVQK